MQTCKNCIMDNVNDPDLILDENGVCNHCHNYNLAILKIPKGEEALVKFNKTIDKIKISGRNKVYDCIIGLSGGVDSTYLCYIAKQQGLRPLLVHCDNGWNSDLAVKNIQNVVKITGFDLYTLVIDWEEMKDIQLSFFKAGVVDLELPYDYALITTAYKAALKHKINYVLTGHNIVTEGTYLPKSWRHDKTDVVNIKTIHKKFGTKPFKTFPYYNFFRQLRIDKKLKYVHLLNYLDYNKSTIKEIIIKEFNWKDYGGKHYENIFTRFYQGYILKEKFKIDKRQFHFSVLVQSKQITRQQAVHEFALTAYDSAQLTIDKEYVIKKLGFTEKTFNDYMQSATHSHFEYASIKSYWDFYFKAIKFFKPIIKFFK